jgi:hypothetical protein
MGVPANTQLALDWLRHGAERLGWPGLLGLVLGSAAVTVWLAVVVPLAADNAEKRASIVVLRAQFEAQPEIVPAAEARNLAGLPGGHALLPLVAAVHAGARQQHIALELGEYVWQQENGNRPARYRMIFPARGSYANLRGWTTALLAARPELVLEEFNLRRENIGSEMLDTRVQFSVRLEGKT